MQGRALLLGIGGTRGGGVVETLGVGVRDLLLSGRRTLRVL